MKSLIKSLIPEPVLNPLRTRHRERKAARIWRSTLLSWQAAVAGIGGAKREGNADRVLIFPSDPDTITGALGDDAMITAIVDACTALSAGTKFDMFCRGSAAEIVRAKGFNPVLLPDDMVSFPTHLARMFSGAPYDALFILGADVMDGYYNINHSAMVLIAADIAARSGIAATILGCSFNDKPAGQLKEAYERLDPGVHLNMRDVISFERVQAFARVKPRLVADSAFTLKPGTADPAAVSWIQEQRGRGRVVVGVNVHPMLIRHATDEQVEKIIAGTVQALRSVGERHSVSWLMLPHDYRRQIGDPVCLKPVHERLRASSGAQCFLLEGEFRAADLKALAGRLDGVITGRMHLAIAALGMGVPVLSLTYQNKFEGLYEHFNLPKALLLPPQIFDRAADLDEKMASFVSQLPALTQIVVERRQKVIDLAWKNFPLTTGAARGEVYGGSSSSAHGACG